MLNVSDLRASAVQILPPLGAGMKAAARPGLSNQIMSGLK
jgi:hypothetical protein